MNEYPRNGMWTCPHCQTNSGPIAQLKRIWRLFQYRRRQKSLVKLWNEKIPWITKNINDDPDPDADFKWGQLVYQELDMWTKIGNQVSPEDFEFICHRRGFNETQHTFMFGILLNIGLGKLLKKPTTFTTYIDPQVPLQTATEETVKYLKAKNRFVETLNHSSIKLAPHFTQTFSHQPYPPNIAGYVNEQKADGEELRKQITQDHAQDIIKEQYKAPNPQDEQDLQQTDPDSTDPEQPQDNSLLANAIWQAIKPWAINGHPARQKHVNTITQTITQFRRATYQKRGTIGEYDALPESNDPHHKPTRCLNPKCKSKPEQDSFPFEDDYPEFDEQ